MLQPIIIAVGGTGQNVLAAYLRLATMAGFTPAPFYVVDSDIKGPQHQALTNLKGRVRRVVGGPQRDRWVVNPYPTHRTDRKTFGELFRHPDDDGRRVFECLFSEEAAKTPIRTGMYGRPAIGAASMRLKFLQEDDDLRDLKGRLRDGEKHVVLVGSCFGGTGSGGVPIRAQEFDELNRQPGYSLRVQALVFLPWFRLVLPAGDMVTSDRLLFERLNEEFDPNAAASIRFFHRSLRQRVESVIYLGVPDPSAVPRVSRESAQVEVLHPLNLLAAAIVQNLFTADWEAPRGLCGYWFDAAAGLRGDRLSIGRGDGLASLALTDVIRRSHFHRRWLELIRTLFTHFYDLPEFDRPLFMDATLARIRRRGQTPKQVTDEMCSYFSDRQSVHQEALEWVDAVAAADERLLPLEPKDKEIKSDDHERLCADPLRVLAGWCASERVQHEFESKDYEQPRIFAEKLADRFLGDLSRRFDL